mmetsp:Transcript_39439/g.69288  ORF Transcript_39439/g.69288 Transcript_39439/m.69288 type:complete len:88 (-) Transcript_39439:126-389(-)
MLTPNSVDGMERPTLLLLVCKSPGLQVTRFTAATICSKNKVMRLELLPPRDRNPAISTFDTFEKWKLERSSTMVLCILMRFANRAAN